MQALCFPCCPQQLCQKLMCVKGKLAHNAAINISVDNRSSSMQYAFNLWRPLENNISHLVMLGSTGIMKTEHRPGKICRPVEHSSPY